MKPEDVKERVIVTQAYLDWHEHNYNRPGSFKLGDALTVEDVYYSESWGCWLARVSKGAWVAGIPIEYLENAF